MTLTINHLIGRDYSLRAKIKDGQIQISYRYDPATETKSYLEPSGSNCTLDKWDKNNIWFLMDDGETRVASIGMMLSDTREEILEWVKMCEAIPSKWEELLLV